MNEFIIFGQYALVFLGVMLCYFISFRLLKHFGLTMEKHSENVQIMNKLMKKRREYTDKQDFLDALESGNIKIDE